MAYRNKYTNLSLEKQHKKALARLALLGEDKKEVELGFATKISIPEKEDVVLITSASFPDNIDTRLDDIVIHRWKPKPKQRIPLKVKKIENKPAGICTVVFEGNDKKYSLPYGILTEEKKKLPKTLCACVFDDHEKKIELHFENQGGSYKLSKVNKEGFDVKRAQGAPVIIQEYHNTVIGHRRYARKIVGVLSINDDGDLYPVLFKKGFLDDRPSRSDMAVPGPSQLRDDRPSRSDMAVPGPSQLSDDRPSRSDMAVPGPSQLSDDRASRSDMAVPGPSQLSDDRPSESDTAVLGLSQLSGEDVQTTRIGIASRGRDYNQDSEKLKEAIRSNTEYQTKLMAGHDVSGAKTDDIFTDITVYYADKKQVTKEQAKGLSRREQLQQYTKRSAGVKVKKCEDIFMDMKGENPKLLLTGKPGIGKTLFCEKVIRDWSMNRLFHNENTPNIKFAYLLKFRHLSKLGDKELNLQELLNCSPLLDDNSIIDDTLFEYMTKNLSEWRYIEVLILLDGFDEYSQQHRKQIVDDFEGKYSNNSREKMPISVLCSKLMRGKLLKKSVVLISSRPGEAEELGGINFDRYVEISGFSPEQVTEYVDKYFSEPEKEQTRNMVREHVEKNENLVSFCHVPLLSFLLCWCLEWQISHSRIKDLPAKITDLYDEVVKVVVQKLHANLKYLKMSGDTMKIGRDTLGKLAKLAASLLKENKYIFDEEDMKKINLTEDEIANLKVSGILHCVPGIRISASQTKSEYSFIHLTLQEFLAASFFVETKEVPEKKKATGQTFVFMSGLSSREKDGELMGKIIQQTTPMNYKDDVNKVLLVQCLYEYVDDELTKQTINNLYHRYCDEDGWIMFAGLTDVDMKYLSYLLDIIGSVKEQHPQPSPGHHTLHIRNSPLTSFGVGVVCDSLVRHSFITGLGLRNCSLDDKCVEKITDSLVNTGITFLYLPYNMITDVGIERIVQVIIQHNCAVKEFGLWDNAKITEECKKHVRQLVEKHKPSVELLN